ncbi:large conductance mechanosensitive channel protein MscL [Halalkalibacter urbisdiaboli]|uniref:large conductance mechanosensitive channel protein MscL n=1 Tax=Halalkalibacter urbisdiaboli TaxID=1960589 RepID=UPI001A97ECAF|nr:large conductance mechanosensitive channel protein MscL [Halalkalibacter urbisdiaboli]
MKILEEFKTFAVRGNVIDMSIGVIIGTTFAKIVESLVDDILMPPFGLMFGQVDFSNLYLNLSNRKFETFSDAEQAGIPMINYGMFLNHLVHFLIIAFVLFLFVRQMNRIRSPGEDPLIEMKTKTCPYCFKSIAYKATRCPHCTSTIIQNNDEKTSNNKDTVIRFREKSS